jgi:hypothetical protein
VVHPLAVFCGGGLAELAGGVVGEGVDEEQADKTKTTDKTDQHLAVPWTDFMRGHLCRPE